MSEHVAIEREPGIVTLRFHRPEKKNAITVAMYEAMARTFEEAEADESVRCVLLTATGETFTAGNDLGDFMARPPTGFDSPVFRLLTAISGFSKPIVAAVDGLAVGIGVTLLLHCDLVVASDRARLRAPFVSLGLVPEAASTLLLPRLLGHARASELLLLGETLDAKTAQSWGLVNAVVPPEELAAKSLGWCRRLAASAPTAVKLTKQLLKESNHATVPERLRHEAMIFGERLTSAEVREAITAFFEKRAPNFDPPR